MMMANSVTCVECLSGSRLMIRWKAMFGCMFAMVILHVSIHLLRLRFPRTCQVTSGVGL